MKDRVTEDVSVDQLQIDDEVVIKMSTWQVVAIHDDGSVTIRNELGRKVTGKIPLWRRVCPPSKPVEPQFRDDYLTVQEFLLAAGMEPGRLEISAGRFGKAVAKLYRERYGKDAVFTKKNEYIPWLDASFNSNAYGPKDIDLLDIALEAIFPSLKRLTVEDAVRHLRANGLTVEDMSRPDAELVWLAEKQIAACMMATFPCGHEECARRRPRPERVSRMPGRSRFAVENDSDMFG